MNITVVEVERGMYEIAKKYFGLIEDDHQKIIIEDGMQYLNRIAGPFHSLSFSNDQFHIKRS